MFVVPALAKDQPAAGSGKLKVSEASETAAVAFPTYKSQPSAAQGFSGDNKVAGLPFAGETKRSYNGIPFDYYFEMIENNQLALAVEQCYSYSSST
ncbi:hypothetical protein TKK_0009888 [Trichogramma kaykai]